MPKSNKKSQKPLQADFASLLLSKQKDILKRGMTWTEQKQEGTTFKVQSLAIANSLYSDLINQWSGTRSQKKYWVEVGTDRIDYMDTDDLTASVPIGKKQTNKQTNKQTYKQTNKQTNKQTLFSTWRQLTWWLVPQQGTVREGEFPRLHPHTPHWEGVEVTCRCR